jgi:hypothetical protein
MLAGAAAALFPIMVAPLAAIGLWQLLIMVRPGYATLFMDDPYRPQLYRWALVALTVTVLLAWYLTLRRWIGATFLGNRRAGVARDLGAGDRMAAARRPMCRTPTAIRKHLFPCRHSQVAGPCRTAGGQSTPDRFPGVPHRQRRHSCEEYGSHPPGVGR